MDDSSHLLHLLDSITLEDNKWDSCHLNNYEEGSFSVKADILFYRNKLDIGTLLGHGKY